MDVHLNRGHERGYGEARCNQKDQFNRKIGLAIAFGRAMKDFNQAEVTDRLLCGGHELTQVSVGDAQGYLVVVGTAS